MIYILNFVVWLRETMYLRVKKETKTDSEDSELICTVIVPSSQKTNIFRVPAASPSNATAPCRIILFSEALLFNGKPPVLAVLVLPTLEAMLGADVTGTIVVGVTLASSWQRCGIRCTLGCTSVGVDRNIWKTRECRA